MDKFKDIKAGDEVFVKVSFRRGFSIGKWFWVPFKVERVTPKRFVTLDLRGEPVTYRKSDGAEVGGKSQAFNIGDKECSVSQPVCDQSSEMAEYEKAYEKSSEASYILSNLALRDLKPEMDELNRIYEITKELEKLIGTYNNY
ncbi:MAG: hypothetical protein ACN2B6_00335 [Rickettsiales bacterium]